MTLKKPIFKPYIPLRLKKFFDKHEAAISMLFNNLKVYKPYIVNSYFYSIDNPPSHPNYKYTDKLYIGCILYIIKYGSTWESFIGPIEGKQLNKRHHEYLKYGLYSDFYNTCLKQYLKDNDVKYLSIDSTIINNKNCIELNKHLPYNKNRKGIKLTTIVDDSGTPLNCTISESTVHDSKIAIKAIDDLANNKIIMKTLNRTKGYNYLLGDSGYDSKNVNNKLLSIKFRSIIHPNNKNTKYKRKRRIKKKDIKRYNKRIVIEHFFAIIKKYPKINCIYEKTITSFYGLILFLFGTILINRFNQK